MIKQNIAKRVLMASGGIAKTADFITAGLSKPDVCALNNMGYIERIRHGYYQLAGNSDISDEQMLATLIPEGIICVESALFYYGYSDFTPRKWSIAVPRTISRAKLRTNAINIKAYYTPTKHYAIGRTTGHINGVTLSIYDRERTICDCFKYRTKLDNETFNKAIHAYASDNNMNLNNLSTYSHELGIYKKVMELMEVVLND